MTVMEPGSDLARASTLPARFYLDADVHEREKERAGSVDARARSEPGSMTVID